MVCTTSDSVLTYNKSGWWVIFKSLRNMRRIRSSSAQKLQHFNFYILKIQQIIIFVFAVWRVWISTTLRPAGRDDNNSESDQQLAISEPTKDGITLTHKPIENHGTVLLRSAWYWQYDARFASTNDDTAHQHLEFLLQPSLWPLTSSIDNWNGVVRQSKQFICSNHASDSEDHVTEAINVARTVYFSSEAPLRDTRRGRAERWTYKRLPNV